MESDKIIDASLPPPRPLDPPASLNGSNNAFPRVRSMHGRTSGPTRRSTRGQWTPEEDETLRRAVQHFKGKNWKKIAEYFKDRTDVQCLHRWQKVLNPELIKGPWSKEEDETIVQLVNKYGPKKWSTISQHLPGRIGKQCRERWHNHLNPSINKEAWTQEEELVLIRAHQIHGNRWAELTKYLPGRTDNAIKNHWNSSVKKKLDSYIASGLLAQFQEPPVVRQPNGDSIVFRDELAEAEQNSECSQVVSSQASDISNTASQAKEGFLFSEEFDLGKLQSTSPKASSSQQYYKSAEDITFTIPDISYEFNCSSTLPEDNFPNDNRPCDVGFAEISLPDIPSMELGQDPSFSGNYYVVDPINDLVTGPSNHSIEYDAFASHNTAGISHASGQNQKTEEGCSELFLQNNGNDGCQGNVTFCSDIIDMDRYRDHISFHPIYQLSEISGDNIALPSSIPLDTVETSKCVNQINDCVALSGVQEIPNMGSSSVDQIDIGSTEETEMKPSRLVPVNTFGAEAMGNHQIHSNVIERPAITMCEQEAGTLCYEPPRFPFLDIPFFSCDLAHSGNDVEQEFSPLGIRQLMSTKMWNSPSSDDSPDAVLKSAAKAFSCTPSILKKRHRGLLSPLSPFSERRFDKKTGSNAIQKLQCTSKLTNEFSRLDVKFDETINPKEPTSPSRDHRASLEDKENFCPKEIKKDSKELMEGNHEHPSEKSVQEEDCASEIPKGVLEERHTSDAQLSSPNGLRHKAGSETVDRPIRSFKNTFKSAAILESMTSKANSILSPPVLAQKKQLNDSAVTSAMVDGIVNEVGAENLNFFGGTPFRRSIESPSAWKSPWYFSSLVNCPRFDADLTIEDMEIFMSPGARGIDAIGLLKQINEQGADAYADAREVLGSETPESILKQRCFRNKLLEGESIKSVDSLASNVARERRVLDFSECETPSKPTDKGKGAMTASLSSPSCLLKSYR